MLCMDNIEQSLRHAKIQLETEKNAHREREFELHQQTAERESQTAYLKARLERAHSTERSWIVGYT